MKLRINYEWTENNNVVHPQFQVTFEIRAAKTPAAACKEFHKEWTAKNSGYKIISVQPVGIHSDLPVFYPTKFAKKNWRY